MRKRLVRAVIFIAVALGIAIGAAGAAGAVGAFDFGDHAVTNGSAWD